MGVKESVMPWQQQSERGIIFIIIATQPIIFSLLKNPKIFAYNPKRPKQKKHDSEKEKKNQKRRLPFGRAAIGI